MSKTHPIKVIAFLLLLSGCSGVPIPCSFTLQHPYTAVCQVTVGGGQGSGTLVAVSEGQALILSCRHVARADNAAVKFEWLGKDGEVTVGRVLKIVPGDTFHNDLALMVTTAPKGIKPLYIAKFDPNNGPWRGVGWRGGQLYEAVSDTAEEKDGQIRFESPLIQGQSGGCLLDKNNCVVGVTVGSNMKTFALAADGSYLSNLIREYTK